MEQVENSWQEFVGGFQVFGGRTVLSKKTRRRKFKPTFENGGIWESYGDLEHQFEDFLEYVPYINKNKKVCSFRLANLIMSIGGHVDSAFTKMAFYRGFNRGHDKCKKIRKKVKLSRDNLKKGKGPVIVKIEEYLEAFDEEYGIHKEKIIFKRLPMRELVQPFKPYIPKTNAPEWWEAYNKLKHDIVENFERATLQTAKDALAGALLLNVRHIPGAKRLFHFGLLRVAWTRKTMGKPAREALSWAQAKKNLGEDIPFFVETPIFRYNYGKGLEL